MLPLPGLWETPVKPPYEELVVEGGTWGMDPIFFLLPPWRGEPQPRPVFLGLSVRHSFSAGWGVPSIYIKDLDSFLG